MLKARLRHLVPALAFSFILGQAASFSSHNEQQDPDDRLPASSSDVITTLDKYKNSLENLLPFKEAGLQRAEEALQKRKELYAQGLISKDDLEQSERAHSEAQATLQETQKQIAEAANLMAEATAADELAKARQPEDSGLVIRYEGAAPWSLSGFSRVESFFAARFGHSLPVSAVGQTALHDRMKFVHRDAIDVALHPDSAQGQELIKYLRAAGISFIAFRSAVPGSATGAHIHIGRPSLRLSIAAHCFGATLLASRTLKYAETSVIATVTS